MIDAIEAEQVNATCPKCRAEINAVESSDGFAYFACGRADAEHYFVKMRKSVLYSPRQFVGWGGCYNGVGLRPPEKPCGGLIEFENGQGLCPSCGVLNTLARYEVRLLTARSNVVPMSSAHAA